MSINSVGDRDTLSSMSINSVGDRDRLSSIVSSTSTSLDIIKDVCSNSSSEDDSTKPKSSSELDGLGKGVSSIGGIDSTAEKSPLPEPKPKSEEETVKSKLSSISEENVSLKKNSSESKIELSMTEDGTMNSSVNSTVASSENSISLVANGASESLSRSDISIESSIKKDVDRSSNSSLAAMEDGVGSIEKSVNSTLSSRLSNTVLNGSSTDISTVRLGVRSKRSVKSPLPSAGVDKTISIKLEAANSSVDTSILSVGVSENSIKSVRSSDTSAKLENASLGVTVTSTSSVTPMLKSMSDISPLPSKAVEEIPKKKSSLGTKLDKSRDCSTVNSTLSSKKVLTAISLLNSSATLGVGSISGTSVVKSSKSSNNEDVTNVSKSSLTAKEDEVKVGEISLENPAKSSPLPSSTADEVTATSKVCVLMKTLSTSVKSPLPKSEGEGNSAEISKVKELSNEASCVSKLSPVESINTSLLITADGLGVGKAKTSVKSPFPVS